MRGEELDDIANQAADDALMAVLAKLDTYRGASRFTTWAYKFALLEAGVRLRRRAWQHREVVLEPDAWRALARPRASRRTSRSSRPSSWSAGPRDRHRADRSTSARCSWRWR